MKNLYTDILNPLHMIIGDADHVGDALDNVDEMIKFLIQKNPFIQNDLVEFIESKNAQYNNNDTTPKITKIFGKDFDSNGGALTLDRLEVTDVENDVSDVSDGTYTKTHESGWTITRKDKIKSLQNERDALIQKLDALEEIAEHHDRMVEELEDVYEERDQLRYTLCNFLGISVMESHDAIITQAKEATK